MYSEEENNLTLINVLTVFSEKSTVQSFSGYYVLSEIIYLMKIIKIKNKVKNYF